MSDTTDAAKVLRALGEKCPRPGYIELRTIKRGGGALRPEFFTLGQEEEVAARAAVLRARGDVYFGVAPRAREEGTKAAVEQVPAVWVDLDREDASMDLLAFPLAPSIVIASGTIGNLHAYWLLEEPVPPSVAEEINRALALRLGADAAAVDASRILRLPDTYNQKADPPASVRLVGFDERRYGLDELRDVLGDRDGHRGVHDDHPAARIAETGPAQVVLDRLEGVRPTGSGWKALCPAHDDHRPSLSVNEGEDGRCLVYCHAGCTTGQVIEALGLEMGDLFPESSGPSSVGRSSAQKKLLDLVEYADVELFHDEQHMPHAAMTVNGHREVWPIASEGFTWWLRHRYYKQHSDAPSEQAMGAAVTVLQAQARFDGKKREVKRRVGGDLERLVIDLCDDRWRAIEVTAGRWRIVERSPVAFIRDGSAKPLPEPQPGGSIEELRPLLNLPDEASWQLLRGFLLSCFHPSGPYPIAYVLGGPGAAKTTLARVVSALIDPLVGQFPMGTPNKKDLMSMVASMWLVGFNNVSVIPRSQSDALCQISEGVGYRARALYKNLDVFVVEAARPMLITAITEVAKQPDLVDRLIGFRLPSIEKTDRRDPHELIAQFEAGKGRVFAGALDALACALAHLPQTHPAGLPRLATAARFVTAAETGMGWSVGSFMDALSESQEAAHLGNVEASPVIAAVVNMMVQQTEWEGNATDLLRTLKAHAPQEIVKGTGWPTQADQVSSALDDHVVSLEHAGIRIERGRRSGGNRDRFVRLTRAAGHSGGGDA